MRAVAIEGFADLAVQLRQARLAVDEPGLTVPHPGVSMRNFVLYPLSDIAPTLDIPGHGRVLDLKRGLGGDGISLLE